MSPYLLASLLGCARDLEANTPPTGTEQDDSCRDNELLVRRLLRQKFTSPDFPHGTIKDSSGLIDEEDKRLPRANFNFDVDIDCSAERSKRTAVITYVTSVNYSEKQTLEPATFQLAMKDLEPFLVVKEQSGPGGFAWKEQVYSEEAWPLLPDKPPTLLVPSITFEATGIKQELSDNTIRVGAISVRCDGSTPELWLRIQNVSMYPSLVYRVSVEIAGEADSAIRRRGLILDPSERSDRLRMSTGTLANYVPCGEEIDREKLSGIRVPITLVVEYNTHPDVQYTKFETREVLRGPLVLEPGKWQKDWH